MIRRRILLLTVGAVASAVCSGVGLFAWLFDGGRLSPYLIPSLSFLLFWVYLPLPRTGLLLSGLVPGSTYIALFLRELRIYCAEPGCRLADSFAIGRNLLLHGWLSWLILAVPAVCLLMDYTRPAIAHEGRQDLRT